MQHEVAGETYQLINRSTSSSISVSLSCQEKQHNATDETKTLLNICNYIFSLYLILHSLENFLFVV